MKVHLFSFLLSFLFTLGSLNSTAQNLKPKAPAVKNTAYPATLSIQKKEFDDLFLYSINDKVVSKTNTYLNNAIVLAYTKTGDMIFFKLKLDHFKNAYLQVQVNGSYSTQVFILSDDKSVSYKGHFEKNVWLMTRCEEGEVVSE